MKVDIARASRGKGWRKLPVFTSRVIPKAPEGSSWWLDCSTREQFSERVQQELPRMILAGNSTNYRRSEPEQL